MIIVFFRCVAMVSRDTMTGLGALVLGAILVFSQQVASALSTPKLELEAPKPPKCWIFSHMNKSGGSSIKKLLRKHVQEHTDETQGLFGNEAWKSGSEYAQSYAQQSTNITWGGYTEALRPYMHQDCQWFTMFRQ